MSLVSFPIDWDGDSIVWLVRRSGARRGGLRPHSATNPPKPTILEIQISGAIKNAKGANPLNDLLEEAQRDIDKSNF